jgi:hypothetical protein
VVIYAHVTHSEVALPLLVDNGAVTGSPAGVQPQQPTCLLQNMITELVYSFKTYFQLPRLCSTTWKGDL